MKHLITILFFILAISVQAQQGMLLVSSPAASPPATTGILDSYTGAAAAYATALLYSGYSGSCLRVRRDSDDAEQDIGFSGQDIDEAAINSFCSGANCFVSIFHDQSGSGLNATQSNLTKQPKIYDSSTGLIYENSVVALDFDGTDDNLVVSSLSLYVQVSFFAVLKTSTAKPMFIEHGTNAYINPDGWAVYGTNNSMWFVSRATAVNGYGANGTSQWLGSNQAIVSYIYGSPPIVQKNGVVVNNNGYNPITIPSNTQVTLDFYIFSRAGTSLFSDGTLQSIVIYDNSDQSANRTGIETTINNYFSIY